MEEDDLDYNPFFLALQSKFKKLYDQAQSHCWLICVPHRSTLDGVKLTRALMEDHILVPSPLFQGQFETAGKEKKAVTVCDSWIETRAGFAVEGCRAAILAEELFYNKDYKAHRVLSIDGILGIEQRAVAVAGGAVGGGILGGAPSKTVADHLRWLEDHVSEKGMSEARRLLQTFNDSYIVVPYVPSLTPFFHT